MADTELSRALESLRTARVQLRSELARSGATAPCAEDRLGCRFRPGDRVFDLVSGEEGEVVGGTVENVLVPTSERRAR